MLLRRCFSSAAHLHADGSKKELLWHPVGVSTGLDKSGSLTQEQLVQIDPDLFLLPTWDYTNKIDMAKLRDEIRNDPSLQTVKAVRNGRLAQVLDRDLFCTSQFIVQGVRGVAAVAYPQLFGED